jgi:D-glycero-alpha-D-manno-heptose-7-phosphate kinase
MIITRTPLRITLGGGGTDLPSFYERYGGIVLSAAINRYIFVALNSTFTEDYFLKYASLERVDDPEEIEHPILREVLLAHRIGPGLEIVSVADIPAGTGLGSSGTFTVGLLKAVYSFKREHSTAGALAEEACQIEIERLNRPVGKQDQYIAAFGGLTCFEIDKDGRVKASPLAISNETLHDLEEHLLLFFTGYSRQAEDVLEDQRTRSTAGEQTMLDEMLAVRESGQLTKDALERGDTAMFADLMHEHWERKRSRSAGMSNDRINTWYELGRRNGARGGKLVGAGGGGFLLFYAEEPGHLREAMAHEGLEEVRFSFDHDGSSLIVRS